MAELNSFQRILIGENRRQARVGSASINKRSGLERQLNQIQKQQDLGSLAQLGTDNDIARTLLGSLQTGTGSVAEAVSYTGGLAAKGFGFAEALTGGLGNVVLRKLGLEDNSKINQIKNAYQAIREPAADALESTNQGIRTVGKFVSSEGEALLDARDVNTLQAIEDSTPTGSLFDTKPITFGSNPSAAGYGYQALGILGEFAPQAAGLLAKSPKVAAAIAAAIGGGQAGIGQAKESESYILSLSEIELRRGSHLYNEIRNENPEITHEDARKEVAEVGKAAAFGTGAVIGAIGGAATSFILRPFTPVTSKATSGFVGAVKRGSKKTALSGAEETIQEVSESVLSKTASNIVTGTEQDITEGSFANALLGGGFGATLGGTGAVVSETNKAVEGKVQTVVKQKVKDAKKEDEINAELNAGNYTEVIDQALAGEFPIQNAASAFVTLANDSNATPEERKKASDSLAEIETKISDGITSKEKEILDAAPIELKEGAALAKSKVADLEKNGDPENKLTRFKEILKDQLEQLKGPIESQQEIAQLKEALEAVSFQRQATQTTERQTTEPLDTSTREGVEATVRNAIVDVASSSPEELSKLASNPDGILSEDEAAILTEYAEARDRETTLDTDNQTGNIFKDNIVTKNKSINNLRSQIGAAVQRGDDAAAQRSLQDLSAFENNHKRKAAGANKALELAKETGDQYTLLPNADKTDWKLVKSVGSRILNDRVTKKAGGITIHKNSAKLVSDISAEADVLSGTYASLKKLIESDLLKNKKNNKTSILQTNKKVSDLKLENVQDEKQTLNISESKKKNRTTNKTETSLATPVGNKLEDSHSFGKIQNSGHKPTTEQRYNLKLHSKQAHADAPAVKELTDKLIESDSGIDVSELISWVNRNGSDVHKSLVNKISVLDAIQNLPKITLSTTTQVISGKKYRTTGTFDTNTGSLGINPLTIVSKDPKQKVKRLSEVIVHEFIHAVTFDGIQNDPEFQKEIEDVISEIKACLEVDNNRSKITHKKDLDYAISGSQELLATVLGKPQLLLDLAKIESKTEAEPTVLSKFLSAIKQLVSQFVPLTAPESNMMDRVLKLADVGINPVETRIASDPIEQQLQQEAIEGRVEANQFTFETIDQPKISGQLSQQQLYDTNRVAAYFTVSGNTNISSLKNFISTVIKPAVNNLSVLENFINGGKSRLVKFEDNGRPKRFLKSLVTHQEKWSKSMDRLYKHPAPGQPTFDKPLSFFANGDKLDSGIKDAISVVAFNFIAENNNNLFYNYGNDAKRTILNLEPGQRVPSELGNEISNKGRRRNSVILELGKAIQQTIDLKLNEDAPMNEEQLIRGALGSMALAVLLDEGYLEQISVDSGLFNEGAKKQEQHIFVRSNRKLVGENYVDNAELSNLADIYKGSQGIMSDIFGIKQQKILPSLKPIISKQKTVKNGDSEVTKEQLKMINKANAKPYKLKSDLVGQDGLLTRMPRELIAKMAGKIDTESKSIHKDNREGVRGKNISIDRDIVKLFDDHLSIYDVDTPFYISHVVWKQFRVGQDSAGINPQSSKLHRAVITMNDWNYDIDIKTGENVDTFKLSVLEALGVKTDADTPENILPQFDKLMADPLISTAIEVIQNMDGDPSFELKGGDEQALADAVEAGGEAMHSFIGLRALANYDKAAAGNGKFQSDLFREGDGKTNGPMIALINMGMSINSIYNNYITQLGGFFHKDSPYKNYSEFSGKTGLDLYKRVAKKAISELQNKARVKPYYTQLANAVSAVLGELTEYNTDSKDGFDVNSKGRGLVKNPITIIIFGAGVDTTIKAMGESFFESFIEKLEKLDGNTDLTEDFINTINSAGGNIPILSSYMEHSFTEKEKGYIESIMTSSYGESVKLVMEEEFRPLLNTRKLLNIGVQMAAKMYSAVYEQKKKELQDLNSKAITDAGGVLPSGGRQYIGDLTKEQKKQLDEQLAHIFPTMHTFFSKRASSKAIRQGIPGVKSEYVTGKTKATQGEIVFNGVGQIKFNGEESQLTQPGVGLPIMGSHSLDSFVAMNAYANMDVLNNHDAVTGSAKDIAKAMKIMNSAMYEGLKNYSIPEEIAKMIEATRTGFEKEAAKYKGSLAFPGLSFKILDEVKSKAQSAHQNKLKFLSTLGTVDQYYIEGGAYQVDPTDNKKVDYRYKNEVINFTATGTKADKLASPPELVPDTSYTVSEVFEALHASQPTTPTQKRRLSNLLSELSDKLYGPMGATEAALQAELGETEVEMTARVTLDGLYPFSSKALGAGFNMTASEMFVLEQTELTMRESMDTSSTSYREAKKLYEQAKKKVKPGDIGQDLHDFIFKVDNSLNETGSDHISRFMALGLVYEPLVNALDFVVLTPNKLDAGKSAQDNVNALWGKLLQGTSDYLNKTFSGQKANDRLVNLVTRLVRNAHNNKLRTDKKPNEITEKINEIVGDVAVGTRKGLAKVLLRPERTIDNINRKPVTGGFKAIKTLGSLDSLKQASNIAGHALVDGQLEDVFDLFKIQRDTTFKNRRLGIVSGVINEIKGAVTETEAFHILLGKANKIEQERKSIIDTLSADILDWFDGGVNFNETDKKAISNVALRTDLSSLLDIYTVNEIGDFISDRKKRKARIKDLQDDLLTHVEGDALTESSRDLGYFIATGKNVSKHLLMNSYTIANQSGKTIKNRSKLSNSTTTSPIIDELVSLYALEYTETTDLTRVTRIFNNEKSKETTNGIAMVLRMHKDLQQEAFTNLFNSNPVHMQKGYTKDIVNPHDTITVADSSETQELEDKGYEKVHDLPQDEAAPAGQSQRTLFILRGIGMQARETGAISFTGMRVKGSTVSGLNNSGTTESQKAARQLRVAAIVGRKNKGIVKFDPSIHPETLDANNLVPVLNPETEAVSDYRYMMTKRTKDEVLKRDNRFESLLAGVKASQFDKVESQKQNVNVVSALYDFYKDDIKKNPNAYLEISLTAKDAQSKETYRLLPEATKRAIRANWGSDKMYIRNDMVDLITGYRNISISNPFNTNEAQRTQLQNFTVGFFESIMGKKAGVYLRRAEDMWQAVVGLLKDIVIIRNFTTLLGNLVSNLTVLAWYGVNPRKMWKGHVEATNGLISYQKDVNELTRLKNRASSEDNAAKYKDRIDSLNHSIQNNKVHELVEQGMFQTIQEDVKTDTGSAYYKNNFDSIIDKVTNQLPAPIKKFGEFAVVAKGTTLHTLLSQSTQMSDFIARHVLYEHLINDKKIDKDVAIKQVREVFVNYDIPTGKEIHYANITGLLLFTKYYLRTQKIILKLFKDKPGRAIALALANHYISGLPTIIDSNMMNRIGLGNPLDSGAFGILGVGDEPLVIKALLGLGD